MVSLRALLPRYEVLIVTALLCAESSLGAILRKSTRAQLRDEESLSLPDVLACSAYPGDPSSLSMLAHVSVLNDSCSHLHLPIWSGMDKDRPVLLHQATKRQPSNTDPSSTLQSNLLPTPAPSGQSSPMTTVHITSDQDFALLLPSKHGELVSDAEIDGVAYCTPSSHDPSCQTRFMQSGFIRAAAVTKAPDNSWVQVTGCIDPSKSPLDPSDAGGQFDVRFPNGAQCSFGGYSASFIEQVEPADSRFCLRCCAAKDDQKHCNSHNDDSGCLVAVPGNYSFPAIGVDCS